MASRYFRWTAQRRGVAVQITDSAISVNDRAPELVVSQTLARVRHALATGRRPMVLIVGMAYKPGVGDVRGSVALSIATRLGGSGVHVEYHDPFVAAVTINGEPLVSLPLTRDLIRSADCVLILCPHPGIDYDAIRKHSHYVIDPGRTLI
jgi:UDP-N-acetyl-D-glucosamine dehydrogenase